MKTVLFVFLLAFAISAFAANDDDIAKTANGYRVSSRQ